MKTQTTRLSVLAGLPLLVAACGADGGIAIDHFSAEAEDAFCDNLVRCGDYPDKDTCKTVVYARNQLIADVQTGKIVYNGAAAADCLQSMRGFGCRLSTKPPIPASCDAIFRGTVADAGACLEDEACVSGHCNLESCTADQMCCAGVCEARIPLGGACRAFETCVVGTFCQQDEITGAGFCVMPIAAGQPCRPGFDECADNLYCFGGPSGAPSTCGTLPAEGQPCGGGSSICDDNQDICDSTTHVCTPRVALGGNCASGICQSFATCDPTSKTCVVRGRVGSSCTDSESCVAGLRCAGGVCTAHPDVPACG